jgi:hypothetical protein
LPGADGEVNAGGVTGDYAGKLPPKVTYEGTSSTRFSSRSAGLELGAEPVQRLMFALLLALAFLVLLMLYFDVLQRPKPPSPTPSSVGRVVPSTPSAASLFRSGAKT